ncbi:MAG: hypothetical protein ABIP08_06670 [Lautropia sp.]
MNMLYGTECRVVSQLEQRIWLDRREDAEFFQASTGSVRGWWHRWQVFAARMQLGPVRLDDAWLDLPRDDH